MMEIGSFIELQFQKGREWHTESKYPNLQIARLNSGRAGIYHAIRCLGCDTAILPDYQCDSVREFLIKKGISIKYYTLGVDFTPIFKEEQKENEAVLLVNYFGIFSGKRMQALVKRFKNVVIDNAQAFFATPIENCMNVYSARKFVGVPDGAYVIGKNVANFTNDYPQGYSSDTASFLLKRIEYGCEGATYESRTKNEERIDREDVEKMSKLTFSILDGTDYPFIQEKRRKNFEYAQSLFGQINLLNTEEFYGFDCVPMVYPLMVKDETLLEKLLKAKHFQGRWWKYLLKETPKESMAHQLSKYMIPITIDQRYGKEELDYIAKIVKGGI